MQTLFVMGWGDLGFWSSCLSLRRVVALLHSMGSNGRQPQLALNELKMSLVNTNCFSLGTDNKPCNSLRTLGFFTEGCFCMWETSSQWKSLSWSRVSHRVKLMLEPSSLPARASRKASWGHRHLVPGEQAPTTERAWGDPEALGAARRPRAVPGCCMSLCQCARGSRDTAKGHSQHCPRGCPG